MTISARHILWLAFLAQAAFPSPPSGLQAQVTPPPPAFEYVTVAPSGSCVGTPPIQIVYFTGAAYVCANGTWTTLGGGGSGGGAQLPFPGLVWATSLLGGTVATSAQVQAVIGTGVYAPTASPAFTGTPTAPTQACASNTDIATGAYVANCASGGGGGPPTGAAGGSLAGTYPNPTLAPLNSTTGPALFSSLTGCATAGFVFSPQNGTCVAQSGGGGGATFPSSPGVVYNTSTTAARNAAPADMLPIVGYYTGPYSSGTTYKFNDIAADGSGNNYISLAAANTGNALTNVTWWHFLGGVSTTITGGSCVTAGQAVTSISTTGVPTCANPTTLGTLSVKNYGALCNWNGTSGTDDTTAFNSASTAANAIYAATGSPVEVDFPQGCTLGTSGGNTTVTWKSGVYWKGGSIFVPAQTTNALFQMTSTDEDAWLGGSITYKSHFSGCASGVNNDLCIAIRYDSADPGTATTHHHVTIENANILNSGWGILIGPQAGTDLLEGIIITNNRIAQDNQAPITSYQYNDGIHVGGAVSDFVISNNVITGRSDAGVAISSEVSTVQRLCHDGSITGNTLYEDRVGIDNSGCSNLQITGNWVWADIPIGNSNPAFRSIYYTGNIPKNVTVSSNTFHNDETVTGSDVSAKVDCFGGCGDGAGNVNLLNTSFTDNHLQSFYADGSQINISGNYFEDNLGYNSGTNTGQNSITVNWDTVNVNGSYYVTIGENNWQYRGQINLAGRSDIYFQDVLFPQNTTNGQLTINNGQSFGTPQMANFYQYLTPSGGQYGWSTQTPGATTASVVSCLLSGSIIGFETAPFCGASLSNATAGVAAGNLYDTGLVNATSLGTDSSGKIVAGSSTPSATFNSAIHFGDSITAGYETTGYNLSSYPYWLDRAILVPTEGRLNLGNPGATTNSLDTTIFGQKFTYSPKTLITYTIGTNNNSANGSGTTALATYLANVEAQSAWWLVPTAQKTLFGSGSVTYTGTWTTDSGGYIGKSTASNGATATFTGTGSTLYVVTLATNANASTASLTCNGTPTGATLNFTALGGTQTQLTRVTGLNAGSNSCVITSTAISGGTVGVEWAGFLTGASVTNSPEVMLGGVPPQSGGASSSALALYRTQQTTTVSTLSGDGLANIAYANTASVATTAAYFNDTFHGDAYWQYLLAQPFIAEVNTLYSTTYSAGWSPTPIVDWAVIGGSSMVLNAFTIPVNTTGLTRSLAVGPGALNSVLSTAVSVQDDVAIGTSALSAFTGNYATAVGSSAGAGTGSGTNLGTFFGYTACGSGDGVQLACIGGQTGGNFTSGGVAVTTDSHDAFIGTGAGKNTASILTDTTALGDSALASASHQMMFGASTVTQNVFHGGILNATLYSAAGTALPSCVTALKGQEAVVTDATSPTYLGTYTSGGTVTAPVLCNGTAWVTY